MGALPNSKDPILTNLVIGDNRLPEQKWVMKEELVVFAGYPLIWNNMLLGVMALFSRHTWTEATMHALGMVASHITRGIEKNLSEQGRKERQGRLQAILDNSSTVIYMKDLEGCYLMINGSCEKLFNLDKETVKGKPDYDIFPPDIARAMRANDQIALHSSQSVETEEVAPSFGWPSYLSFQ